ncbi:hypothetical protein [Acidiphilium sp. PM]|jgi:hypothetical protein|nr:hypothetical protein [Acidiphilium sp. PM]
MTTARISNDPIRTICMYEPIYRMFIPFSANTMKKPPITTPS